MIKISMKKTFLIPVLFLILISITLSDFSCSKFQTDQTSSEDSTFVVENYDKYEYQIPMRDGKRLFTSVYVPKDKNEEYPIMLNRTPYNVAPYGENKYKTILGPSRLFTKEKYIFVYEDVRGRFMSEGDFVDVRPHIPNKQNKNDFDESSDTYDTVEWLIKNIPDNNGKVGIYGISYPGFYTVTGIIDAHPAVAAASPQAPIADWFWDDFHHHGAFFLIDAFDFYYSFGQPRPNLTTKWLKGFDYGTPDGYKFFLELGSVKNVNEKYFKKKIKFWNDLEEHPNYDEYWQARNIRPHLKNIKPAVLTVGGWFDAEDLFGAINIYKTIEENNPGVYNIFVMGPWNHGGWTRTDGTSLGNVFFKNNPPPSKFYQEEIELKFFNYYLKGKGKLDLPEAYMFETGTNKWRTFSEWPPKNLKATKLFLHRNGEIEFYPPAENQNAYDEFISDPNKSVPYTETITTNRTIEYMTDDQRFASRRPDVLTYQIDELKEELTIAGALNVDLYVSTTGSDADWIVKLIDVYPDDHPQFSLTPSYIKMGGYQQMVRSEVFRGRFRNSYEKPEAFVPNKITKVKFPLQDVLHTFKKGHRFMIQIQSTWFPLVDRNPQKYVANIFKANEKDFIKATHRVYRSKQNASSIGFGVIDK
jgi:uncharacterized protein